MPEVDYKEIVIKLKYACLIAVFGILVVSYIIVQNIVPAVTSIQDLSKQYTDKTVVLEERQTELSDLQVSIKKQAEVSKAEKDLFIPLESGLDTEGVIATEFSEILEIIRANTIKMRSINYTYDPSSDTFVTGAPDKFHVAQLDMEIIGSYLNFENFLRDLYKHEHFLDISSIKIEPYEKNKSILLINFTLKLYAKRG